MRVALAGAELEENLGLRYIASALEREGHQTEIVAFNSEHDTAAAAAQVAAFDPQITGLSMVFTNRACEFCGLASALRNAGYRGHLIAGGPFASFNCERLLKDHPAFDSAGLGEGEGLLCAMARDLRNYRRLPGLCYRAPDGSIAINPSAGNPDNLDALPFPKRTTFHSYFDKPIASLLTSRGCWRDCAFCSINAWYLRGGGKKFRVRSVENVVAEMKELYYRHGIRIFNVQDDNFFLPNPEKALERFRALRAGLEREGVQGIAIAVKARPDSINYESIRVLDDLGLFRVFLGVENASENGLRNLNRNNTLEQILNALRILNDFDVHLAYNLLLFEPDTTMQDLLINLRFIERHIDNPFNFCRAEAYPGTGLEAKLRPAGRLLGDYFGFDYRLGDPRCEAFHQIANYAFFDRNFSDFGLHYFNMQVDFYFQLLRRFHPEVLSQTLRGAVRTFIKQTNLDTYECLCRIYDFAALADPGDQVMIRGFAREMREHVDQRSQSLHLQGERLLRRLEEAFQNRGRSPALQKPTFAAGLPSIGCCAVPYRGTDSLHGIDFLNGGEEPGDGPIPYHIFKSQLSKQTATSGCK
jgi:radical SAM superfamily enzyme YgiQ (UPF0313 family)